MLRLSIHHRSVCWFADNAELQWWECWLISFGQATACTRGVAGLLLDGRGVIDWWHPNKIALLFTNLLLLHWSLLAWKHEHAHLVSWTWLFLLGIAILAHQQQYKTLIKKHEHAHQGGLGCSFLAYPRSPTTIQDALIKMLFLFLAKYATAPDRGTIQVQLNCDLASLPLWPPAVVMHAWSCPHDLHGCCWGWPLHYT